MTIHTAQLWLVFLAGVFHTCRVVDSVPALMVVALCYRVPSHLSWSDAFVGGGMRKGGPVCVWGRG